MMTVSGPEAQIEKDGCDYAEAQGLEHRKLAWVGRRDAPDRIFWGDELPVFFIEVKAAGKALSPGQFREIEKMRRSGTRVYVCDSLTAMLDHIDMEIRHAAAIDAY